MVETDFLQALMAPEYWEVLESKQAVVLNRIDYCGNTLAGFIREQFLVSFSVFATRNPGPSLYLFLILFQWHVFSLFIIQVIS